MTPEQEILRNNTVQYNAGEGVCGHAQADVNVQGV